MFAIPPHLDPDAGDQLTGIGCPECPGALQVRAEGTRGYLLFTCRISHIYSADDLLVGKEKIAEDRLWAAVLAFEEMAALLSDLEAHAVRHGHPEAHRPYQERRARATAQAQMLRQIAEDNRPINLMNAMGPSEPGSD
jgi:hypothetical protein